MNSNVLDDAHDPEKSDESTPSNRNDSHGGSHVHREIGLELIESTLDGVEESLGRISKRGRAKFD